nr:hypothetical protein L204_03303 [Cryptococcus depauperatus CBS 7855]
MSGNNGDANNFATFNLAQINQLNPALFAQLAGQLAQKNQQNQQNQQSQQNQQNQQQQQVQGQHNDQGLGGMGMGMGGGIGFGVGLQSGQQAQGQNGLESVAGRMNITPQILHQLQSQTQAHNQNTNAGQAFRNPTLPSLLGTGSAVLSGNDQQTQGQMGMTGLAGMNGIGGMDETVQNIILPMFNRLQNQNTPSNQSQNLNQNQFQSQNQGRFATNQDNSLTFQNQIAREEERAREAIQAVQAAQTKNFTGVSGGNVAGASSIGGMTETHNMTGLGGQMSGLPGMNNMSFNLSQTSQQTLPFNPQQSSHLGPGSTVMSNQQTAMGTNNENQNGQFGQMMGLDESKRRAALQNMLNRSNSTSNNPQLFNTQSIQRNQSNQGSTGLANLPPEIHEFMRQRPELAGPIIKKFGNNQGSIEELVRLIAMLKNQNQNQASQVNQGANQSQMQQGQVSAHNQGQGLSAEFQSHLMRNIQGQISQTQQTEGYGQGHQRVGSDSLSGIVGGQFLQQMKAQQARQGLNTPQIPPTGLMPSPQLGTANANYNLATTTPQTNTPIVGNGRLSQTIPSQLQTSHIQTQPVAQARVNQIGRDLPTWPLDKLLQASVSLGKRISEYSLLTRPLTPNEQASKFQLLLIISEIRRRGAGVTDDVLDVAGKILNSLGGGGTGTMGREVVLNMDHEKMGEVARMTLATISRQIQAAAANASASGGSAQQVSHNQSMTQLGQTQSQVQGQVMANTTPQQIAQRFQQAHLQAGQASSGQITTGMTSTGAGMGIRGSQNNPIELMTPTLNNAQLSFSTPQQSQTRPQIQSQSHQQGQAQGPNVPMQGNPVLDINDVSEEMFYNSLRTLMVNKGYTGGVPNIEGKPINLLKLFQIVINNNGSTNIDPMRWTFVAGQLGFSTPSNSNESSSTQPGQLPASSMPVAQQIRTIYATLLQPMEDAFMSARSRGGFRRPGLGTSAMGATSTQSQSVSASVQMDRQASEQISKQQRRFFETTKSTTGNVSSGAGGTNGVESWLVQQAQQRQQNPAQVQIPQASSQAQAPPQPHVPLQPQTHGTTAVAQGNQGGQVQMNRPDLTALKMLEFIKVQEMIIRKGIDKQPNNNNVNPEAYLAELRSIYPLAKEVEQRLPIFMLMVNEASGVEPSALISMVHMSTSALYAAALVDRGRYIFNISDFQRLRTNLSSFLMKAQMTYKQMAERGPQGQQRLKTIVAAVQAAKAITLQKERETQTSTNQTPIALPGQTGQGMSLALSPENQSNTTQGAEAQCIFGLEAQQLVQQVQAHAQTQLIQNPAVQTQQTLAAQQSSVSQTLPKENPLNIQDAIRQKGLRIEDLKPPPRRGKGKGSPAIAITGSGVVETPEAKTPINSTQPPTTDSPRERKAAKRKRAPTTPGIAELPDRTPKQAKTGMDDKNAISTLSDVGPENLVQSLELQISAAEAAAQEEATRNKPFFDRQKTLATAVDLDHIGAEAEEIEAKVDPVDTYNKIFEEYQSTFASQTQSAPVGSQVEAEEPNDQDLFDTYFDATQFNLAADMPTPDLVIETPAALQSSPSNVKIIGSSASAGSTGWVTKEKTEPDPTVEKGGKKEKNEESRIIIGSPESMAYNGGIEW